jgi:2-oxoglutarate dehydrogenase E2 component (dihydrolipoamide succinyltransferase)
MPESVFLPKWGLTMTEATIVHWLKQEGDVVAADAELVEVETDKVVNTLTAPVAGVLAQILVKEGETVEVGTELAVITPQ